MAISTVRVQINGTWHNLTYNSTTKAWEGNVTAPGATSFHQSGGYYNVTVEATNQAGTTGSASGATMESLRLVVKENIAPIINILSPSGGAYVTNARQPVIFTVTDEAGGSGVDLNSLVVKLDGTAVAASTIANTTITNGYQFTYTPASAITDGGHTVTINISDHDGNKATEKSTTFTVDTVPPTLNISSPVDGVFVNKAALTIQGVTNDVTSSPVVVKITLNGTEQGSVTVGSDGAFSKTVTLTEGANSIVVTATDVAGKSSSVTRTANLDTTVPVIQSATISPNPTGTGGTVKISVVIV